MYSRGRNSETVDDVISSEAAARVGIGKSSEHAAAKQRCYYQGGNATEGGRHGCHSRPLGLCRFARPATLNLPRHNARTFDVHAHRTS